MAASPLPFIFTWPEVVHGGNAFIARSVIAPSASRRARRPSEYLARTTICCSAPGFSVASAGNTSSPVTVGSLSDGRGRARRDPFGDYAIFERIGGEPFAAAVRNGEGGLQQHQAVRRIRKRDAPADDWRVSVS